MGIMYWSEIYIRIHFTQKSIRHEMSHLDFVIVLSYLHKIMDITFKFIFIFVFVFIYNFVV